MGNEYFPLSLCLANSRMEGVVMITNLPCSLISSSSTDPEVLLLHPGVRAGMSLTRELPEKAPPMFRVTSILFSLVNISGACSVSDIFINRSG